MNENDEKREIWVFGNPDVKGDSLPLRVLPELKKQFPHIEFVVKDPNEEWDFFYEPVSVLGLPGFRRERARMSTQTNADPTNRLIIIDTVQGINRVEVFDDLNHFSVTPRVTMHDFDVITKLRWLQKIGKVPRVTIIGIPPSLSEQEALNQLVLPLEQTIQLSGDSS